MPPARFEPAAFCSGDRSDPFAAVYCCPLEYDRWTRIVALANGIRLHQVHGSPFTHRGLDGEFSMSCDNVVTPRSAHPSRNEADPAEGDGGGRNPVIWNGALVFDRNRALTDSTAKYRRRTWASAKASAPWETSNQGTSHLNIEE